MEFFGRRSIGRWLGIGRGRMGGIAAGPGGICKCPSCRYEAPQLRGYPCMDLECPNCGTRMIRG